LENEEHDVEQVKEDDTNVNEAETTLKNSLKLVNRLRTCCPYTSGAVSLSLISQLQSNFDNQIAIQEKNKLQFSIFSYNLP